MAATREKNGLNPRFLPWEAYAPPVSEDYHLLPLRFLKLDETRYIVTNFAGEYILLSRDELVSLVSHKLSRTNPLFDTLKARHFIFDNDSNVALDLLAMKYRSKAAWMQHFTALHYFIVTLRCDHTCRYCQVSRQTTDKVSYDMSPAIADKAIDFMFRSPSRYLKVEFQGGEPLLNFELVKYIVEAVKRRNEIDQRCIEFVVATNLSTLTDEHLAYFLEHDVYISTSLDGPRDIHNANRPRSGHDSYERTVDAIWRVRQALGPHRISALMTTTSLSLKEPERIIDEYVLQGFNSIFLRSISPYGFAARHAQSTEYDIEEWLQFYKCGLAYILDLNRQGLPFREVYAGIVLRKMLTPYAIGYVDLQSPAAVGIGAIGYNYDGGVYPSDESRMLAEMGDKYFCLGNLLTNSYEEIMLSDKLVSSIEQSMTETVPCCADCGIQPYCGSDPVFHYRAQGDVVGYKPRSAFCKKNMGIVRYLIGLIEDSSKSAEILRSWAFAG